MAVLHTRAVAVPLFPPGPPDLSNPPGRGERLRWALRDCRPSLVLTTASAHAGVRELIGSDGACGVREVIAVDEFAPDTGTASGAAPRHRRARRPPRRSGAGRTVRRFAEAFEPCGLDPAAQIPAYGPAEATAYVSMDGARRPPRVREVDRDALAMGVAVELPGSEEPAVELVSCGRPVGQRVAVVDPRHGVEVPEGAVGEIWVQGPNVADAYWGDTERSVEVFGATMFGAPRADPAGDAPWLRTGDLGVVIGGELCVTGRVRDSGTGGAARRGARSERSAAAAWA
ncbi:AMP-binding protein [Spinactinospora alkalitolerans]|uniref:AMP-binding protein n=1 Tax=Spinactinospora alkalitolerans TaxID=687207 RepID=UPI001FE51225